jgi:ATP-dependent helicase/nuclease subunit A
MPLQQGRRLMAARSVVLSPEQDRAIHTPGSLFVRAGAGSGKTEILARRFVALVTGAIPGLAPLEPERIAAVTFSEKAAHDMRERITAVMSDQIAQASDDEHGLRLRRAIRKLPLARICTLHAFCARLLRENALAAGLDPAFDVIDEYQSAVFLEREAERALLAAIRAGDPGALYLASARGLRGSTYREGALPIVLRLLSELNRVGRDVGWILELTRATAQETSEARAEVNQIALQIAALVDQLLALPGLTGATAAKVAELACQWPKLKPTLLSFDADSTAVALDPLRNLLRLLPHARAARSKTIVLELRELISQDEGKIGLTGVLIEAWGAQRAAAPALAVAELLVQIADAINLAKRLNAVVTFDDLLLLTHRLLRSHPSVVKRYQELFGAILVDEFQDTDPLQDEIIGALCTPAPDAPPLFIVGDEKQSIYRFRGADVTVFNARRKSGLPVLPLSRNRRSTPSIVAFANAFGASIMRTEAALPPAYWVQWAAEHHLIPERNDGFNPPVEILCSPEGPDGAAGNKTNAATGRRIEATALARRITKMVAEGTPIFDATLEAERPCGYGDIAILMRAFTDVRIYERALRAAAVPFYTVKGRGLFGCQEVIDLVELLTTVNDPRDSLALAAALRSPFFTLSDDALLDIALHIRECAENGSGRPSTLAQVFDTAEPPDFAWLEHDRPEAESAWRVLHELRAARDRVTVTDLLDRLIELTGFEAVMLATDPSGQRAANVRRMIELARAFEAHHFFTFHDFVVYLRRLVEEEPREPQAQILGENENVVRIMTVHQAKGLEFPIVIVADLWRGTPRTNATPLTSPNAGLVLCDTIGSGFEEVPNRSLEVLRESFDDQEKAESTRILYVAITRARDRLILSAIGKRQSGTWGGLLADFVAELGGTLNATEATGTSQTLTRDGLNLLLRAPDTSSASSTPEAARSVSSAKRDHFAAVTRSRINFEPPVADSVVLSPSELEVIARCPREYHWRYQANLPPTHNRYASPWITAEAPNDASDSALRMGLAAHEVLERLDFGTGRVSADELERLIEAAGIQTDLSTAERNRLLRDLSRYLAEVSFPFDAIIEREVPFFLQACDAPSLFIRGRIDLLCITPGRITLRDYKYAHASDPAAYQLQMELYGLAVAEAYPGHELVAELVFLGDASCVVPVVLPPFELIRGRLRDLAREFIAAHSSHRWPKRPPSESACRQLRCGYIPRCWGLAVGLHHNGSGD